MVTVAQTALKRSQGRLTTRGFSVLDLGGFVFRVLHFGPFRVFRAVWFYLGVSGFRV